MRLTQYQEVTPADSAEHSSEALAKAGEEQSSDVPGKEEEPASSEASAKEES